MAVRIWHRIPTHLRTFLFLVPFAAMLAIGRGLGVDNNLLAAPRPGKLDGSTYNLVVVLVFWAGILGYYIHMTSHAAESASWAILKLIVLLAVFAWMAYMSLEP